jgi:hypothetical protein
MMSVIRALMLNTSASETPASTSVQVKPIASGGLPAWLLIMTIERQ